MDSVDLALVNVSKIRMALSVDRISLDLEISQVTVVMVDIHGRRVSMVIGMDSKDSEVRRVTVRDKGIKDLAVRIKECTDIQPVRANIIMEIMEPILEANRHTDTKINKV